MMMCMEIPPWAVSVMLPWFVCMFVHLWTQQSSIQALFGPKDSYFLQFPFKWCCFLQTILIQLVFFGNFGMKQTWHITSNAKSQVALGVAHSEVLLAMILVWECSQISRLPTPTRNRKIQSFQLKLKRQFVSIISYTYVDFFFFALWRQRTFFKFFFASVLFHGYRCCLQSWQSLMLTVGSVTQTRRLADEGALRWAYF